MPTITVDKDKLELALAKKCGYFQLSDTGEPLCHKPRKGECHLDFITKIEVDCPYDCPHRDEYKWKRCTLGKCSYVKKIINDLKI